MKRIFLAVCLLFGVVLITAQIGVCSVNKIGDLKHKGGKLGPYRALLIGISTYEDSSIKGTSASVKGAKALSAVLKKRYGFSTDLLLNKKASKEAIIDKIKELGSSAGKNGSVIIYFAGNGEMDSSGSKGYWYPSDAGSGNTDSYLANEDVQAAIRNMGARDVLLISDCTYGDTYFGSAHKLPRDLDDKYYLKLYNKRSRWGFTSGNDAPKGRGSGKFTDQIINTLKANQKPVLSVQELYESVKPVIRKGATRPPRCRSFRNTGDQGGELIFVLASQSGDSSAKPGAGLTKPNQKTKSSVGDSTLTLSCNVVGAEIFMDGVSIGKTPMKKHVIPPGSHKIEVKKEGYKDFKKNVIVKRGASVPLTVDLDKIEVKITKGNFTVESEPKNASVKFVGKKLNYVTGMLLEEGAYKLEISAPFYEKQVKDFSVKAKTDNIFKVSLEPVKSFNHKMLGKFHLVKAGDFTMGSPDNESMRNKNEIRHKVTLTKNIYMQESEVTLRQWRTFIKSARYKTQAEAEGGAHILVDYNWEKDAEYNWGVTGFKQSDDHPVVCISWNDTQAFIKWINKKTRGGLSFRLPTEAEWEYACRAGTDKRFSFGDCITRENANFDGNAKWGNCPVGKSSNGTVKAGSYQANAFGLHDMHGNVMEWCQDWFGNYPAGDVVDPAGPVSGTVRVVRGGGWTSYAYNSRSAKRYSKSPDESYSNIGFRLVVELK